MTDPVQVEEAMSYFIFPLSNQSLRSGILDRTSLLGGSVSFCWIRICFFSTAVGENCQRLLASVFAGLFFLRDFSSITSNRLRRRPARKIQLPRIPVSRTG